MIHYHPLCTRVLSQLKKGNQNISLECILLGYSLFKSYFLLKLVKWSKHQLHAHNI